SLNMLLMNMEKILRASFLSFLFQVGLLFLRKHQHIFCFEIILYSLFSSPYLYVCKSIMDNLISMLKEKLKEYPIQIKGTQNVGLRLEGNEFTIRKVLIEQFSKLYQEVNIPHQIENDLLELKRTFSLDESSFDRLKSSIQ